MLKFIWNLMETILCLAFIAVGVLVIMWLIKLNNMSSVESFMYNIDTAVNGQGVAMFRNFQNYATSAIENIINAF